MNNNSYANNLEGFQGVSNSQNKNMSSHDQRQYYTNMMKDFQDLENFKAIDENEDVERNSYGLVENQQDYNNANNMV